MGADEPSENELQLRFVANAVPALLAYVDVNARYIWCNESYRRWFGYAPETLRGRHMSEVLGASVWTLLQPYVERVLLGEAVTFDQRLDYKRGGARDIRASYVPHMDSKGRVRGFVVLSNDISEIRSTERALRRSEHMLERSQSSAHVGSFEVPLGGADDASKGSVHWSDETYRMFGLEPGAVPITHASFFDHIHPEDRESMRTASPPSIEKAEPFEREFRIVRADGTVRLIHTWVDFERDVEGKAIRMVGTCQDVTERRHAELELRAADRRKDEFLAMLSHELRNPMAPILSAIEIIERAQPGQEELRTTYQAVIARQVQHMKRLLDDLLDVSRVSQGKIELRKQRLELSPMLLQAVEVSRPMMLDKRQHLAMTLGLEPMPMDADPTRIVQVFANLLNNAAKYTGVGGQITLVSAVENGEAVVTVRDNGRGMAPELLANAFELFVQGARSSDRTQGGLGIGLTMVQTLVKMHGGSVKAFSDGPGRGSQLVVRLPLAPADAVPIARAGRPASDGVAAVPLRVLLVDDNIDAAYAMKHVLELSGHRVTLAHDGPGALAAAAADPPELVLLDIGLPGMDGYAVAARLRQAGLDRAAIVAVTGYGQEEDLSRSSAAGFDHHLVKPVDGSVLRKIVAEAGGRLPRA
jgi:two-component system CheB/CheR fusion protein